nr:bifunctional diguanylate cyclase/phosphodiesterase [Mastigocoleus sp. MO_167.B18]
IRVQNQLALFSAQKHIKQLNLQLEKRIDECTKKLNKTFKKLQQEILEKQKLKTRLHDVIIRDSLTGLPNRVLFINKLETVIKRSKEESDYHFAVLFLDCDRFKIINDSLGHAVGDRLLIAIAQRLSKIYTSKYTLARFGGDEFAILLENLVDVDMAVGVAKNILHQLSAPFYIAKHEIFINASIGIIWGDNEYEKPEYLLRDVDTAMYRAKDMGRARYHIFNPEMHRTAIELLELENDLRRAIKRQEFLVYYQPIVSLTTGNITAFEALVRWQHPTRGLLFPNEFIPVAEETDLISEISMWVLNSVCQQLSFWQHYLSQEDSVSISVNLSPKLFSQYNLIAKFDEIINRTNVNPMGLKLEITESMIVEHSHTVKKIIQQLKLRNIKLIMDDFGTGYSCLSYLHSLPFSSLKIDQSFIKIMENNQNNMGLVPAIIAMAHSMGMTAIAEGVETKEQLAQLRNLNCDFAQGYLFAEAVDSQTVLDLIAQKLRW